MYALCQPMDFPASVASPAPAASAEAGFCAEPCAEAGVRASLMVMRPTPYAGITR